MNGLHLISTGRCLPARAVTNEEMSQYVETSDEWIASRTGIRQRYFCGENEGNISLASDAARRALERAAISPDQIGLCIVATFTPEHATPSVACMVQRTLGLPEDIPAFDVNAACSGFLYSLSVASAMLPGLNRPYALLIGSEVISRMLDMTDRATCVLFGDGAGAAIVKFSPDHPFTSVLGARGEAESLGCPGWGADGAHKVYMDGKAVFRFAVETVPRCIDETLAKASLTLSDIDHVVCHQANARIIRHVERKLHAPEGQFYMNVDRYANTSAASIPLALDEMNEQGLLTPGKRILCVGFGAGFTWGGALLTL